MAIKTTEIFKDLVEQSKWADARSLFKNVRTIGKKLIAADKMNFTVGNVVKRVYHIIREECKNLKISIKDTTDLLAGGNMTQYFKDIFSSQRSNENGFPQSYHSKERFE